MSQTDALFIGPLLGRQEVLVVDEEGMGAVPPR